ncbi:hypothetical protein [Lactiplantibacillus plantarum]|uniref:hypothetical protein n=1 Tax=Lactiplantibacillus plantarum TaxID=1590 RepID=UPI00295BCDB3|nr:hypothetical protein [Lactiplantibacillus plantarum]MDV9115435.1 hypothetical protein [Lactiplantibacillus plantarum]
MICLKYTTIYLTFIGGSILPTIGLFFGYGKYWQAITIIYIVFLTITTLVYLIANIVSLKSTLNDNQVELTDVKKNRDGLIEQIHTKKKQLKSQEQDARNNRYLLGIMYTQLSSKEQDKFVALSHIINSSTEEK